MPTRPDPTPVTPLLVLEKHEEQGGLRAMLVVLGGRPHVWVNVPSTDSHTAERWARRQLAAGKLFAFWTDTKGA